MDGFNLYHAIDDLGPDHLKWVNLWTLAERFARPPQATLERVYYYSAYATWMPDSHRRHRAYVAALIASGVTPVLGRFKNKTILCKLCGRRFCGHEEKESDVNIALGLYRGAVRDEYTLAIVVSGDSDLAPAIRLVRQDFPTKQILVLTPVGRGPSGDLLNAAGGFRNGRRMKRSHIDAALLPQHVHDSNGQVAATRPIEYDPPPPPSN